MKLLLTAAVLLPLLFRKSSILVAGLQTVPQNQPQNQNLLSPFPRNGVYIPDEDMPPFAQLNEFHDVCVVKHPIDENEHDVLLIINESDTSFPVPVDREEEPACSSLEPNWNADGLNCGMAFFRQRFVTRSATASMRWVSEPTAVLAFFFTNPGHFVSDVLWSLFPRFNETDPFTQTWLVDDEDPASCTSWACERLQSFYSMKNKAPMRMLEANSTTCFKTMYIPQLTRWRWQPDDVPNLELSASLRQQLTASLGPRSENVLIYTHEDGHGRAWKGAEEVQKLLVRKGYGVRLIRDFKALSPRKQCQAFWDARVILTPHGGQMGNLLCADSGTTIVEMSCEAGSGWFAAADRYKAIMGWNYGWEAVPPRFCLNESSNPFFDSFRWPAKDAGELFDKWVSNSSRIESMDR